MQIKFVEIANFRKLHSVRIDLSDQTTVFVGSNNSGKSSAISALQKFLSKNVKAFDINDITICHWEAINKIGEDWVNGQTKAAPESWNSLLPTLDLWIEVQDNEFHYVRKIIPTLDWDGGLLGVRIALSVRDEEKLLSDFIDATNNANALKDAARAGGSSEKLTIWPTNLVDFLRRRLTEYFAIKVFALNPNKLMPQSSPTSIQSLPLESEPIEEDPLKSLIKVFDIPAQRGLGELPKGENDDIAKGSNRLSVQLRAYYAAHLDPTDHPDITDLQALQAIEAAQDAFNERLEASFKEAFMALAELGYPGLTDPEPRIATKLKAVDGMNHAAAVSFKIDVFGESDNETRIQLPEHHNGLGYQNLISIIFRLMSFRDDWMKVGKLGRRTKSADAQIEPILLVLIEEPEAHLHAQVQQVFMKRAYSVLRKHPKLGEKPSLKSQMVISTHSSHIAHAASFADLRYFRRLPAGMVSKIPTSTVVNLSNTFGSGKLTEQFVTRYLRAQHADLFFADALILVEGPAERMLVPNFIKLKHPFLDQCYVTLLEIGGSHAHKLKPLIDELKLLTLVITDLDSKEESTVAGSNKRTWRKVPPEPNKQHITNNTTLKDWLPGTTEIDSLYAASNDDKICTTDQLFSTRVAYQMPLDVTIPNTKKQEKAYPYTFEDAFVFENLEKFSVIKGSGLVKKFREAIETETTAAAIGKKFFEALESGKKAEFALDVMDNEIFEDLSLPTYIAESLDWLEKQLRRKREELLPFNDEEANHGTEQN